MRLLHVAISIAASLLFSAQVAAQEITVYRYGMKLDIKRVINISDTSHICGVTSSIMTYEDTDGNVHHLQYQVHGGGCSDN
ncbi:DUF2790 domain-containing protein [Pseudomonas sp. GD03696]|uniref:DUF2790 domain-containing protein n=1 Tax=Pseudomonas sp. GD03696 TaxID=2975368 RepID=UPI00244A17B3|nr:DUF2790 domain-containing protein [Pseudomonas sp. GD03696]MDH1932832.1 DUF2790 domain-containing protein [Pseudomonas sp. GD03696]